MDRFNGLDVPESLEDALDPRTLAFVVYDTQALAELVARSRRAHQVQPISGHRLASVVRRGGILRRRRDRSIRASRATPRVRMD